MKNLLLLLFAVLYGASSVFGQWELKSSGTTERLNDVFFPSLSLGYAVGEAGTVLKSTDIGETWIMLEVPTSQNLEAAFFLTDAHGFVVGNEIMLETVDGGENWTEIALPLTTHLMDVEFTSAAVGFCVGIDGVLLKTVDGGVNWVVKDSDCSRHLVNIQFPSEMVGYAVSLGYNWNFIKTVDGGETWLNG